MASKDKDKQQATEPAWRGTVIKGGGKLMPWDVDKAIATGDGEAVRKAIPKVNPAVPFKTFTTKAALDKEGNLVRPTAKAAVEGTEFEALGVDERLFGMPWIAPAREVDGNMVAMTIEDVATALPKWFAEFNAACTSGVFTGEDGEQYPCPYLKVAFPKGITVSEFLEMVPRDFAISMSNEARDETGVFLPKAEAGATAKRGNGKRTLGGLGKVTG